MSNYSVRSSFLEMTALGVAIAAGLAVGVWTDVSQLPKTMSVTFDPKITPDGTSSVAKSV